LALGLGVYFSYGYTRSGVGQTLGRPARTPLGLKLAAICCVLIAVGLFVIPHDVAPRELFSEAFDAAAKNHKQTMYGLLIIAVGLIGAALGVKLGSQKRA
jgi:chromate transport protein ChrA